MGSSADRWVIHQDDRPGLFPQFLIQSMLDRPIVVFHKGRPSIDSRMPRKLKADIVPRLSREGARVNGTVRVQNLGDTLWLGGEEVGHVRLGIQLLNAAHGLLDMEFSRVRLSANVPPKGALEIEVDVTLPDAATPYVLKLDLVDEGICWFEDRDSRPVYLPL
jgi:hypothetical protein